MAKGISPLHRDMLFNDGVFSNDRRDPDNRTPLVR